MESNKKIEPLPDRDSFSEDDDGCEADSDSEFSIKMESSDDDCAYSNGEEMGRVAMPCPRGGQQEAEAVQATGHEGVCNFRHINVGQSRRENYAWIAPNMIKPELPPFTGVAGCAVKTENGLPINYFQLFVDDGFIENIVQQTNLHAEQYLLEHSAALQPNSRAHRWTPTSLHEMKQFWGLTLLMGILRKPMLSLYWSCEPMFTTPIFPSTMSRDRFMILQRMLHFIDNTEALPINHPQCDRLFKIRPILNHFKERFAEVYVPCQNVSVDEPLILYKGRLLYKRYIKSKRALQGIKLYRLCESSSGYTYSLGVYAGRISSTNPSGCPTSLNANEKVVWELACPLFHKGYNVYVHDEYTGVQLFKELFTVGTVACGSVRSNSTGYPKELVCRKLKHEESSALRCNNLLAVKFHEGKDAYVLTTIHDESSTLVKGCGQSVEVKKPKCVVDYNLYMGEAVGTEQIVELYNAACKIRSWYKKLAVHMIQIAMYNAYTTYCQATPGKKKGFLEFELSVISSLVAVEAVAPNVDVVESVARLQDRHFADYIPPTPKKTQPSRRCRVCARRGRRKESRFYCPQCPSKPALCMPTCYTLYHTKENFWELP